MKTAFIGIDLGGTAIKGALLTKEGEALAFESIAAEAEQGGARVLHNMTQLCQILSQAALASGYKLSGIGIGTPGLVDQEKGCVVGCCPNLPGWAGIPFIPHLSEQFKVPVKAHNDVSVMALGEFHYGAGKGARHMVAITLGTGIGGGFILNGKLYDGAIGYAGEVGHMRIRAQGRRCSCGGRGCWETYASARGLVLSAQKLLKQEPSSPLNKTATLTAKDVFVCAGKGDALSQRILDSYFDDLAKGLTNLLNIFNPDLCLIGGGLSQAGDQLLKPLNERLGKLCMPSIWESVTVKLAGLGEKAGVYGALSLVVC